MTPIQSTIRGLARLARKGLGLALVLTAVAGVARANFPLPAPEIDPGSAAAALTLLAGGTLLFLDRIRKR
jgi:hypothetical protein